MVIERLDRERTLAFVTFCRTHRAHVDDSFLYEEDLRDFDPGGENPTYLAVDDQGHIVGAASVMNSAYFRRGRKGRLRIFHVENADLAVYAELLDRAAQASVGLDQLYVFVPAGNTMMEEILHALRFRVERSACVMVRDPAPVEEPVWGDGYSLRTMVFNQDENDYCHVRNLGFAQLKGSETAMTPDEVSRLQDSDGHIPSGILLLYHQGEAVGVVRASTDDYEGKAVVSIGPLALVPSHQGRGLGRQLLRAALSIGRSEGLSTAVLSANTDNDQALSLYTSEGFRTAESVVCHAYRISR